MRNLNLKSLLSYLMITALIFTSVQAPAQTSNFEADVDQWLASPASLELSHALSKLEELIVPPTKSEADVPAELAGLFEDSISIDEAVRQETLLNDPNTGLIFLAKKLDVSEYNKLILVASVIYREHPEVRLLLGNWFQNMQTNFAESLGHTNSPGKMMAESAISFVLVMMTVRTGLALVKSPFVREMGNSRFVQGIYSRFRKPPPTYKYQMITDSAKLPAITPNNTMSKLRGFLRTQRSMVALYAGAAAAGTAFGGIRSHLYNLQTQRISPVESLQMMQSDLACELAHTSIALRKDIEAAALDGSNDWEQLTRWSEALQQSVVLNADLAQSFPSLVNLWTEQEKSWPGIREQFDSSLRVEGSSVSCTRIKREVIDADLMGAANSMHNHFINTLFTMDPAQGAEIAKEYRELFEMNASWLTLQDDMIDTLPWLKNVLAEIETAKVEGN